jgi:hypothetical protein
MRYLILVLLLSSCGPGAKLRRAEKLIAKAEQLGAQWRSDTTYQTIEVPVVHVELDTMVVTKPNDTIYLEKDRLTVEIIRRADTIRIAAECLPDTIKVEVPVRIERDIVAPKPYWTWWKVAGVSLILLIVGMVVGRLWRS